MSTSFLSPGWRMPTNKNQNKQTNYSLDFIPTDIINVSGFSTALSNVNNGTRSSDNNLPFSWSVWFKSRNSSNSQGEIAGYGQAGRNGIRIHNNVFRSNYTSDLAGTTTIIQDKWYHGVVTYDGTTRKIYINGVFDNASDTPASAAISNQPLTIGVYPGGTSSFNGELNELCFFDYALSASQVTTLYGNSTNGVGNPMALPSSPIAYYPLGGSAGAFRTPVNVNDQWLIENNAIGDYVFDFDGSTSYITTSVNPSNYSALTASAWINFDSTTGRQSVFSQYQDNTNNVSSMWMLWNVVSNELWFFIIDSSNAFKTAKWTSSNSFTLTTGNWYNVVGIWDGSYVKIYVNGEVGSYSDAATSLNSSSLDFLIGSGMTSGGGIPYDEFNGKISNVQVFNTALSGPEITTLYNYGSPIQTLANIPQSSNLKAWYKLDASEIYNSTTTDWEVNQATAEYSGSILLPNAQSQITSEYIQVSNYAGTSGLTSASYSFWYYTANFNTNVGGWISGGVLNWSGYPFGQGGVGGNQTFQLYTSDGTQETVAPGPASRYLLSNSARALNVWVNVVLTYDGSDPVGGKTGSIRAYVNGVQQAIDPTASPQAAPNDYRNEFPAQGTINTGNLIFGTSNTGNTRSVNAQFSNFAAWNKALSQSEITEIVNGGQPKDLSTHSASSNLVSWWKFDNKTTGLVDSIGGINATIVGSNSSVSPGSVSTLNGTSSGMTQANLIQSDLQTVAPYSKYAMSFDGTDSLTVGSLFGQVQDVFSVSTWVNFTSNPGYQMILSDNIWLANYTANNIGLDIKNSSGNYYDGNGGLIQGTNFVIPSDLRTNEWINVAFSYVGSSSGTTAVIKMYLNGAEVVSTTVTYSTGNANLQNASNVYLGSRNGSSQYLNGSLSNLSIWNYALTASQVREIYNQGLPSDLNTFSGTAPVAWWQLGENSSYVSGWTFADEIASNNGTSGNLPETALTNGVGTTANGVSTGMGVEALIGDAPYSTANAISSNMSVLAKGTDPADIPS